MSTLAADIKNTGFLNINIKKKDEVKSPSPKNVHVYMEGDDIERLNNLKDRIYPHTKKDVVLNALRLLDEIIKEIDEESVIYIKRKNGKMEEYPIFG